MNMMAIVPPATNFSSPFLGLEVATNNFVPFHAVKMVFPRVFPGLLHKRSHGATPFLVASARDHLFPPLTILLHTGPRP